MAEQKEQRLQTRREAYQRKMPEQCQERRQQETAEQRETPE